MGDTTKMHLSRYRWLFFVLFYTVGANIPYWTACHGVGLLRLGWFCVEYAMVGVFVAKFPAGVRVAITGASQGGVFRHDDYEKALSANFSAASIAGITTPADGLNSDIHASAEYRAHLTLVMAKRAVDSARP